MPLRGRTQWVLIGGFLAMLWTPLLLLVFGPERSVSMAEKRELAPRPGFEWSRAEEYPDRFEAYYNDHFGLRSTLIRWYNIIRVVGLGVSNSDWALVGKDGWLFQGGAPHFHDMRNAWPYSQEELAQWARVLQEKNDWLASQGILYRFVVTPNKHLIYPERLPGVIKKVSDTGRIDQLVDYLREHTSIAVLDLRSALLRAKAVRRPYHKTDTHWNAYGGYVGYREIIDSLDTRLPDIRVLDLPPRWTTRVTPGGDLANVLDLSDVLTEERIEHESFSPSCARNLELGESADDRLRNKHAFTTTCRRAGHRLLMFRDSYSLAMMPYLSESFGYVYYVPNSPVPLSGLQELVREKRPDVVIEQRASRWLRTPEG